MTTEEAIERLKERSAQLKQDAQDLRDDEVFNDDPDIACNELEAKAIITVLAALAASEARAERAERERDVMVLAAARLAQYDEFCPMDVWGTVPATIQHIRDRITEDSMPELDAEWVRAVRAAATLDAPATGGVV